MMSYIREAWYPVVWADRVGRELTRHTVLEEPIVIYRLQDGGIAALQDACPHRLAPLSLGRLKGDDIECGYHGMTFDCAGKCVLIPGQDIIPGRALVRAYPVQVKYGLVWLYMGDARNADPSKIFHIEQYDDPAWHAVQGDTLRIECNYLSLCDNLLDPAHVTFVHATTLGTPAGASVPVNNEYHGNEICVWRWIRNAAPIGVFAKFGGLTGMVDRWHYYNYSTPSYFKIDMGSCPTGSIPDMERRSEGTQMYTCHVLTPVDQRTVLQHWFHVRNFHTNEFEMDADLSASLDIAFREDKVILERIQLEEERAPDFKRIILGIDAAPMKMRRMVDKLIAAEAAPRANR
ncbi:vanillate O-demethylase oxygenase [Rhodopseudomonas sp. AAP120]|nr:vanillate O-demethylase oxygenase [Rhodopseudomonas sp. AAP120]